MALKSRTITLLGITFCVACLIALIISFASDKWIVSTETEVVGFENLGLWSVCFDQYRPPSYVFVDRLYEGCWWVLDKELELLRDFLFPGWFVGTQVLVTLGLVFELISLIGQIVNMINCFPYNRFRDNISLGISIGTAVLHGVSGILLTIAIIMFGVKAMNSGSWLEKPDQNYLSWSFGMCVLAAFLAFIAMLCQLLEFARLRLELGRGDEPDVFLTDQAPPESRYAYSPAKFPPHPQSTASDRKPAYANRYYNNGRATSGRGPHNSLDEPRPPDTLFAVSGAGELYINRLADYDERDDDDRRPAGDRQYGRGGGTNTDSRQPPRHANGAANNRYPNGDAATAHRRPGAMQSSGPNHHQDKSKTEEHPVLPEYVRKPPKPSDEEIEDSDEEIPEKQGLDSSDSDHSGKKGHGTKKSRSSSHKSKAHKSSKDNDKKAKNSSSKDSDHEGKHRHHSSSKKKSKKGDKYQDSDEESTHRSRKHSTSKSKSKHRSRSRDLNTSRESYDSNTSRGRSRSGSRSRRRSRSRSKDRGLDEDRKSHKRSGSREGRSTKKGKSTSSKNDYWSDDMSEASTKRKGRTAEAKARARDYSDGESVRGRSTVKSTRPSQGGGGKPKGTYSSYYEY